ncbi:MAG: DUF2934 domain-containing protein [Bryobacteraceae bacterium]|jgi:hypothetical protein
MARTRVKQQDATNTEARFREHPEDDQIASQAYSLWQARGCPNGLPDRDWLQAEQELTSSR